MPLYLVNRETDVGNKQKRKIWLKVVPFITIEILLAAIHDYAQTAVPTISGQKLSH